MDLLFGRVYITPILLSVLRVRVRCFQFRLIQADRFKAFVLCYAWGQGWVTALQASPRMAGAPYRRWIQHLYPSAHSCDMCTWRQRSHIIRICPFKSLRPQSDPAVLCDPHNLAKFASFLHNFLFFSFLIHCKNIQILTKSHNFVILGHILHNFRK